MKPVSRDMLIELYVNQKMNLGEIAVRLNTHRPRIGRLLREFKIPKRTKLAENNNNWKGGIRKDQGGHIRVYQPEHSRADGNGYVSRSILVWEEFYGMPFPVDKEPHHDNEIKDDDRPENIIPLTHSGHTKLHRARQIQKGD